VPQLQLPVGGSAQNTLTQGEAGHAEEGWIATYPVVLDLEKVFKIAVAGSNGLTENSGQWTVDGSVVGG